MNNHIKICCKMMKQGVESGQVDAFFGGDCCEPVVMINLVNESVSISHCPFCGKEVENPDETT